MCTDGEVLYITHITHHKHDSRKIKVCKPILKNGMAIALNVQIQFENGNCKLWWWRWVMTMMRCDDAIFYLIFPPKEKK